MNTTKAGSKGGNLRDKLDCKELDLSLSNLNQVPVKELAALPKATILDLSCNKLTTLPSGICGLTHLVKLDLSKNKLQQLPADFSRLVSLQHLDLLNNRMATLPLRLEVEHEAEKKPEAKQRAKEAQERELRKRQKAAEKECRRKEYDALKAAKREQKKPKKETNQAPKSRSSSAPCKPPPQKHTHSWAVLKLLLLLCCVVRGLVACRVTELLQQTLCTSVNTIYDNAVQGLHHHEILQDSCDNIISESQWKLQHKKVQQELCRLPVPISKSTQPFGTALLWGSYCSTCTWQPSHRSLASMSMEVLA
ncbi:Leucine-rich repeat-containing protein 59 [Plecturocebus cupreus]